MLILHEIPTPPKGLILSAGFSYHNSFRRMYFTVFSGVFFS